MALYGLDEVLATPVAPWSVQEPASMVVEVAYPIAELCEPKTLTA